LDKARNDLSAAVPKFCLALEEHRRTPDGRVRTSQELLNTFFPHDEKVSTDKLFKYLPNEVRGPIIAAWGIRGIKAALRDNDERIQGVVYDALIAGDVDHSAFEEGLTPETLVRWVPLGDLWAFWRGGKLTKQAIHKALSTAYELYLFDARWFLDTISSRQGALKGTAVLSDGLTKDELTQWIQKIHESGDGTPKGLVGALGWEKIVAKTPNDVLVAVLDAVAGKVGLVTPSPSRESTPRLPEPAKAEAKAAAPEAKPEPKPEPKAEPAPSLTPQVPMPAAAAAAAAAEAAEAEKDAVVKVEPLRPTDKPPPAEDGSWSAVPPPPPPEGALTLGPDEGINVVIDDDMLLSDKAAPPTAPRMRAATPAEEDAEAKPGRRSERPPARPPTRR
jgi:hypothetical protein